MLTTMIFVWCNWGLGSLHSGLASGVIGVMVVVNAVVRYKERVSRDDNPPITF